MLETILASLQPVLIGATIGDFIDSLRDFVAPILLGITSILAVTFLIRRQMMQVLTFAIMAIIVFAIFYAPEMFESIGKSAGDNAKNITFE